MAKQPTLRLSSVTTATSNEHVVSKQPRKSVEDDDDGDNNDASKSFPRKLMNILDDEEANSKIISWLPHGNSFMILSKKNFETTLLPKYFKRRSRFSSFARKLNRWGFSRVVRGPESGAYYHQFFKRGEHSLCNQMSCKSQHTSLIAKSDKVEPENHQQRQQEFQEASSMRYYMESALAYPCPYFYQPQWHDHHQYAVEPTSTSSNFFPLSGSQSRILNQQPTTSISVSSSYPGYVLSPVEYLNEATYAIAGPIYPGDVNQQSCYQQFPHQDGTTSYGGYHHGQYN